MNGSQESLRETSGRNLAVLGILWATMFGCNTPEPPALPDAGRMSRFPDEGVGPLDALSRRFGRLRHRLTERGYDEVVGTRRSFALEGKGTALPMDLDTHRCTTFVALAGGGVRDLVLSLYDREGDEVALDAVEGEGALVHICPQAGTEGRSTLPHYLALQAVEGSGAVITGAFASGPGTGQGFDELFAGLLAPRVPVRQVEEKLARRRGLLRSRGLLPLTDPIVESVAEGEELTMGAAFEAGRCYVAIARGDDGLSDVDLMVFDAAGAEVARDIQRDAEPHVEHCPSVTGRYMVRARAFEGAGALGLMVLGGPASAEEDEAAPDGATEGTPVTNPETVMEPVAALNAAASALAERGYGAPTLLVQEDLIGPGEVRTHELALTAGCLVVMGAAARSDTDLDLYLTDANGRAVARDTGVQPMARVRACPIRPEVLRVTVKSYGRRSSYALTSLRAPEGITEVRELRLEEATASLRRRGFVVEETFEQRLSEGERFEQPVLAPAGRCVAVAVAGGDGVEDVDVFLRGQDGQLLASASGPEAHATVRHCALEVEEPWAMEVRLYRGEGLVAISRLGGPP